MAKENLKQRKKIFRNIILSLIVLFIAWIIWGNITIETDHFEIKSPRLPQEFSGYKIAQISDLHNAEFGKNNSRLISILQEEQPDIIVITGDLIDSNRTDIDIAYTFVEQAVTIAPCYYVTGNHEAWARTQYGMLEEKMTSAGVTILHDQIISLEKNDSDIQMMGVDDPDFSGYDEYSFETQLPETKNQDDYMILLSHRPEFFDSYVEKNIDLVLSGHAHGGQFRLPFIGGLIAPNQGLFPKYDAGLYRENGTHMVVSRGIGNSVIPVRFNDRPEVVIVTLTRDEA